MEQVAKMLGVELGEVFENISGTNSYVIYKEGLFSTYGGTRRDELLIDLLLGNIKIKKIPWKPKENESYYCVDGYGEVNYFIWSNEHLDLLLYKIGNCFKTEEEITPEIIKKYIDFLNDDERIIEI
jgi:hypothetical protein